MQAVLDFLLEYFYWILGVLVILLITVIGFLADTKRKKKLRENNSNGETNNSNVNLNMNMGGMNMNNELNNMNMGIDNSMNAMPNMGMEANNVTSDMNVGVNNMNVMPNVNMNMMNDETVNVPSQIDANVMPSVNEVASAPVESAPSNDSFFTPASAQTPTFAPRDVTIPTPVEPTPIMNNNVNTMNSWDVQGSANVSPVEVVSSMETPEVQPSVPSFGPEPVVNNMNTEVNQVPNFEGVSAPVVPEPTAMPEQPANLNVMPEVASQIDPVVNPQMNNPVPGFGPSMEQVPPVNTPVAPNFVTGAVPQNNMPNNNMNNLNG